jgi:serralysin
VQVARRTGAHHRIGLRDGGGAGPSLRRDGAAVIVGQFGAWTLIGAEQAGTGYQVAWKFGSADQYLVWNTDNSGTFVGNATGVVTGEDEVLKALEPIFQQDLNHDTLIL